MRGVDLNKKYNLGNETSPTKFVLVGATSEFTTNGHTIIRGARFEDYGSELFLSCGLLGMPALLPVEFVQDADGHAVLRAGKTRALKEGELVGLMPMTVEWAKRNGYPEAEAIPEGPDAQWWLEVLP